MSEETEGRKSDGQLRCVRCRHEFYESSVAWVYIGGDGEPGADPECDPDAMLVDSCPNCGNYDFTWSD